ncbi:hypothetical protein HAX54_048119 [Datura stramonium]|uniref:Uncharacterized protein n=1 Tax=Datura stramonium TaxID=4076 RepID=A0ABS8SV36_DATST|nr:hypothetical protein [Datura stramonium]
MCEIYASSSSRCDSHASSESGSLSAKQRSRVLRIYGPTPDVVIDLEQRRCFSKFISLRLEILFFNKLVRTLKANTPARGGKKRVVRGVFGGNVVHPLTVHRAEITGPSTGNSYRPGKLTLSSILRILFDTAQSQAIDGSRFWIQCVTRLETPLTREGSSDRLSPD